LRDALECGVALARMLEERQNFVCVGVSQTFWSTASTWLSSSSTWT